jgi:hypothetical protein
MAITNGYLTRAELKTALAIGTADTADDVLLDEIVNTASRLVDAYTGQFFYKITAGTATFTPETYYTCNTLPFTSITSLKTDEDGDGLYEITWSATDYQALPSNAPLFTQPYTRIEVRPTGTRAFPINLTSSVQIVGDLGWTTHPADVGQATTIQATTIYEARKSPFGIAGATETGIIRMSSRMHPEAQLLLEGYRLHNGIVG